MTDGRKRLVEAAFPVEQVSLDSVHEKNVRHGHISTLHIWPARRPLAACRAALIATLLPDPDDPDERRAIHRRMAGKVVETVEDEKAGGRTVARRRRSTRGGVLHWKREDGPDLDWFRGRIREAYGGRAPRVLDPFAGGGAIPLEAMRLGCAATAADVNPVAWFLLTCTLDWPQKLAGRTRPLPAFARRDRAFMAAFLKAKGVKGRALARELAALGFREPEQDGGPAPPALIEHVPAFDADLAWSVRAWGRRVLAQARRTLAPRYPTYAEFRALAPGGPPFEPRPRRRLEPDAAGDVDAGPLNREFDAAYLGDKRRPRWVATPTVAYLWARTARCKGCRATIPLLKTRWLAKKGTKRVRLTMTPNGDRTGVVFGVEAGVPAADAAAARRRAHDRELGGGTMSRSGAQCPCCGAIATMEDLRLEGRAGRLGAVMTAVVVDGPRGKEYRLPTDDEIAATRVEKAEIDALYAEIPFGLPDEPICADRPSPNSRGASGLPRYGFDAWRALFTGRQLLALGTFVREIRRTAGLYGPAGRAPSSPSAPATGFAGGADRLGFASRAADSPLLGACAGAPSAGDRHENVWREALAAYLTCAVSKLADYGSAICSWDNGREALRNTFARFALPMVWDYCEVNPLAETTGGFPTAVEWVANVLEHLDTAAAGAPAPAVTRQSAIEPASGAFDLICTDPPYYDAIPYSDLMDFFHVWLRRALHGLSPAADAAFGDPLGPKWDRDGNDGELVDQPGRFAADGAASRAAYEDGMFRVFRNCRDLLGEDGRLVVVFANKQPAAWETLVSALIRAGFVVNGSWPIRTEMQNKVAGGARLASSIWLVCRKRTLTGPGWDAPVLAEMRRRIHRRLREFWDAGIRGPDFVWAATGPALEAFSQHPVVKQADAPGARLSVSAFLREVRRFVVDFVVGRVLTAGGEEAVSGLDDVTTYYLLHRYDFGLGDAPAGACILYALSCNLSDRALADRHDLLARGRGGASDADDEDGEAAGGETDAGDETETGAGAGGAIRLKPWSRRKPKTLGADAPDGRPAPLIDQAHRLMQLWSGGDESKVNDYLDARGLTRHALFARLLQAVIEMAPAGSEERAILESLSNHVAARAGVSAARQPRML